jgi:hypothetical protein
LTVGGLALNEAELYRTTTATAFRLFGLAARFDGALELGSP